MKNVTKTLMMKTLLSLSIINAFAGPQAMAHGGGNGGNELELDLKKRSLQIGYFVKSTMGSKVFKMLNPNSVVDTVNSMDVDVVSDEVHDKFGTIRTCINEPDRKVITCNEAKISALLKTKEDILTATLFHEILGLMEVELGYQDNVSMYPISSKIIPYHNVVVSTPITEAQIRPEYYGLDKRSYGVTLVNKKSGETLRMICLNDNVEVHRCRNYSIVRKANGMQIPLVTNIVSVTPEQIKKLKIQTVTFSEIKYAVEKLESLQANGYKFISLDYRTGRGGSCEAYRFGAGAIQAVAYAPDFRTWNCGVGRGIGFSVLPLAGIPIVIDLTTEAGKQVINTIVYPVKAIANAIRSFKLKRKIKAWNKQVATANLVVNFKDDLSLVGTTKKLSESEYNSVIKILTLSMKAAL